MFRIALNIDVYLKLSLSNLFEVLLEMDTTFTEAKQSQTDQPLLKMYFSKLEKVLLAETPPLIGTL